MVNDQLYRVSYFSKSPYSIDTGKYVTEKVIYKVYYIIAKPFFQ